MTDVNQIADRMGSIPMGQPMDPQDHIADSGHNAAFNKGRAGMLSDMNDAQKVSDLFRPLTDDSSATNYTVQPGKAK